LYRFVQNSGKIYLICSTNLTEEDQRNISLGYSIKSLIDANIDKTIDEMLEEGSTRIRNLCWLIKNNYLDIKICQKINKNAKETLFHEKFGYFKDKDENIVSFIGSINETYSGWIENEESFEVSYNWEIPLKKRVDEKVERFQRLWNGVALNVRTYEFSEASRNKLIKNASENYINETESESIDFSPRKCQKDAGNEFIKSGFNCLFMMATGTGKTKAALYAMRKVMKWRLLLIIVPGLELVEQWERDVQLFFPNVYIIKCSSNYKGWQSQTLLLVQSKLREKAIVIITYDSAVTEFAMDKWNEIKEDEFAMICDEVHNIGAKSYQKIMTLNPRYRIGLSATPKRNFDEEGSNKILEYYNNNSYEFSIADAILKGYLVEYEYSVWPCAMDEFDWINYCELTAKIQKLRLLEKDKQIDEQINRLYRERAAILKRADVKVNLLPHIFTDIGAGSRILIYGDTLEHVESIRKQLDTMNQYYFVYTGDKDSKTVRPTMLKEFSLGIRKILIAIGCLDEGIDIPICDVAIFLSSSTSERQFIQRRGRVLRTHGSKKRAYIYDFLLYPDRSLLTSDSQIGLARRLVENQYMRINQITEDAINGSIEREKLDDFLEKIGLNPYRY